MGVFGQFPEPYFALFCVELNTPFPDKLKTFPRPLNPVSPHILASFPLAETRKLDENSPRCVSHERVLNGRHEQDDSNEGTLQDGGGHPPGSAEIQQQEDREPPSLGL